MAKTAVLYAADFVLAGVGKSKAEIKAIIGEQAEDLFVTVTAKTFVASEQHPSFAEMCGEVTEVKAKVAAAEPVPALDEDGNHIHDEDGNPTFVEAEPVFPTEKKTRATASSLSGEYHVIKQPAIIAEDHPRQHYLKPILANTDVETAKAACPEKLARAKNGFFTFGSEFRYLITRGVIAMGPAPEVAEPDAAEGDTTADDNQGQEEAAAE